MRTITDDTERGGTAPNLVALVVLPLRNDARKVPARRSRQGCVLEVSRNVPDVARVDPRSFHVNEYFRLAGVRNRTSSIRNTDGGPNSVKRNDFITLILIAPKSRLNRHPF